MAVIFNQASIAAEAIAEGIATRRLITPDRVKSDHVRTEIVELSAGSETKIVVDSKDVAWAHILEGEARLTSSAGEQDLSTDHFLFLPPGFSGRLASDDGAKLFTATVPDAQRFDPDWAPDRLTFRCIDWAKEPVLNSVHDARKRIYTITPKLSDTKVVKGEVILYPAGTEAANHHHEGAEHFQYILRGTATFYLNEVPHRVNAGDTVYIYENERHYFVNDGGEEMAFVEYFVPGKYKTIWAEDAPVCTWEPSDRNIRGGEPSREIGTHTSMDQRSDV
jgi:quercetin dioxygenase-like cupin family protein